MARCYVNCRTAPQEFLLTYRPQGRIVFSTFVLVRLMTERLAVPMIFRKRAAPSTPSFTDILAALPIEEQRAALQWLREIGNELGCTIDEEILVSKDLLDFLPGFKSPRSLN